MTTKERVVRKSINIATKRLTYLEGIQNASPASELLAVRKEAQQLLEDNKGIEKRTTKSFIDKIGELAKQEKECWKMINRQKKWMKDSDEMANLMQELNDLKNELFYIERTNRN